MKTICIYHDKCYDGVTAAWVVSKIYPSAEFIKMGYDMDIIVGKDGAPVIINHDVNLIIVDFSFSRERMIQLNKMAGNMIVLDHHKTALDNCIGLSFCKFDLHECGSTLAWKHLFPNQPIPLFLSYIRDRDLWENSMFYYEEVQSYIQSNPQTIDSVNKLVNEFNNNIDEVISSGNGIIRFKNNLVDMMTKEICIVEIGGFQIPVVNASILASEVTNKLCKDWPQYPFSASYVDNTKKGIRLWRLTSIGEFDVSEIAKLYGGGGHRNAAGFQQVLT